MFIIQGMGTTIKTAGADSLSAGKPDAAAQAKQRMQRYRSVFMNQNEQIESKEESKKSEELDPETLYHFNQKQQFKSILWLDKLSRVVYMLSYFLFLLLYWKSYKRDQ